MKNKKLIPIIAILMSLNWSSQGLSLVEETHQTINEYIAQSVINGFSLDVYLINQVGLANGIKEELNGSDAAGGNKKKQVLWWLGHGGFQEDRPGSIVDYLPLVGQPTRSVNHFHNPVGGLWEYSGLDAWIGPSHYTGQSSILWAQNPNQDPGGKWSWHDARNYFYQALTTISKTQRETQFANTFRCLGQLMHLVHDASVPSHVRNQIHILFNYEKWVEKIRNEEEGTFHNFIVNPIPFDPTILNLVVLDPSAPVAIANIIDTDMYGGSNPDITAGTAIGIAEYTNANFFSERTIFKNYPYPAETSVDIEDRDIPDPRGLKPSVKRPYYIKKRDGESSPSTDCQNQGKQGYRVATVDFLYKYIKEYFPTYTYLKKPALDGGVYYDYAEKLLPRAVGYSAGLLEYFFRGQLQVTAVPVFYKNSMIYLRAKIKNMTPNETMSNGTFTLTYNYRPTGGNPDGSEDIWAQAPLVSSGTLEYGGDDQHPVEDTVIDFLLPTPIPKENYDSAKFTLAFRGTLGNEVGAVIGKALTLGEIKFEEEWDNGLNGNHTWAHTDFNLFGQNPDNGTTSNIIEGDTLIKDNVRGAGSWSARVNESFVSAPYMNGQFKDILPIQITPDTYIQFKIDEMWINQKPPAPPGYTCDWQFLWLGFNNGLGIQYFTQGQGANWGSKVVPFEFDPNFITMDNIYEAFKKANITIPPGDLYLETIDFIQQLWVQDNETSNLDNHQHMKIDSIRIVEGKKQ